MAHPQALGHFRDAAAIFRLAETVNDGAFEVTDVHRLLFGDPMLRGAEIMLRLDEDEVKFRAVEAPALQAFGAC